MLWRSSKSERARSKEKISPRPKRLTSPGAAHTSDTLSRIHTFLHPPAPSQGLLRPPTPPIAGVPATPSGPVSPRPSAPGTRSCLSPQGTPSPQPPEPACAPASAPAVPFPQTGPTTSLNLAAHCLTRSSVLSPWSPLDCPASIVFTQVDHLRSEAPSYTHRGSVSTETTHKVNLSENLFRQMILYGRWCRIPSRHQRSLGRAVRVWHFEPKDFLPGPRGAFGAVSAWRRDPRPGDPANP